MPAIAPIGHSAAPDAFIPISAHVPQTTQAQHATRNDADKTANKPDKPQNLRNVAKELIRNTFNPKTAPGQGSQASHGRNALSKEDRKKEKESKLLAKVLSSLEAFAEDPAQIQAVMAALQEADGSGADGVLNALRQAKEALWSPKADNALRNSSTILSGPVEGWTPYQRSVNKLVKSVATLERFETRTLTENVVDRMPKGSPDLPEAGALRRLIDQMIFFNVDKLDELQDVKAKLSSGAAGGLSTLQEAVEGLRHPRLDDLVRNAASTFSGKTYEELSPNERRLARLVTALQRTHLEWARVVKDVVVPKPAAQETTATTS